MKNTKLLLEILNNVLDKNSKNLFYFNEDKMLIFSSWKDNKPRYVLKCGPLPKISKEYNNYQIAKTLIPNNLLSLCYYKELPSGGILCFDYVENKSLSDILFSVFFRRRKKFFLYISKLFDFYLSWLKSLNIRHQIFNNNFVSNIQISSLDNNVHSKLHTILSSLKGITIPFAFQHMDFSVINIRFLPSDKILLIDWEDALETFALNDFAMLYVSIFSLYYFFFRASLMDFHLDLIKNCKFDIFQKEICSALDIDYEIFVPLFFLSLYSLWLHNLEKGRHNVAKYCQDILSFFILNDFSSSF